ncbi:MAG: hypothetical protein Q9219_005355 [cf. Caloplaca sp. 3 TL-2023]
MCCSTDILLALLAVLFPPLPVWIKSGICTLDSFLNILLCFLGFIPGLLHAWYVIAKYPDPSDEYEDLENGRGQRGHVTYYYVSDGRNNSQGDLVPTQQQYPNPRGYGTVQAADAKPGSPAATQYGSRPEWRASSATII